ncbi:amidohydrolase [Nocardioides sp. YIM 152315]|uniref:M20 metallopeptidase family protein n=1 Tax=Nocardioides sp. YIM 152315 TaxID=3031760 RepID=UPI0023DB34E6|nr:amidohydrolase [Nocardioides sp. YIM 152315]MDF1602132.1 amidohydrolase [Nocardioides sp. YIM 152315]
MTGLHAAIDEACAEHEEWLIASRAWLHAHPELSNREEQTAAYVAAQLRELGLDEVRTGVSGHGVVGVLRGGLPGERVIALRADMDALPVRSADGIGPVSHACGHDCHVAVVLTTARVLAGLRDRLPGTVVFFFQPAEEGPPLGEIAGAKAMLDAGALAGVEPTMVFAMHVVFLPKGVVGYHVGNQFAAACAVDITLRGVQAHGSSPWLGVDPMPAAAQVILGAGQLYRQVPAASPVAVSFGHVEDVGRFNIIGESLTLSGTMRSSRQEDMPALKAGLERLVEHSAAAYGCTAELQYHFEIPAVRNEQAWLDAARPTLERVVGAANVVPVEPVMGSDDMAELVNAYGGLYLTYGVQDTRMEGGRIAPVEGGRGLAPNHHPAFYADDASLLGSVRVHAHVAVDHLLGALGAGRVPR